MLTYIKREPKVHVKNPPLLVLVHGYGSNENDLFSFAEELPDEFLIVALQAPYELGYGGYAWYAINFDANNVKHSDFKQAQNSIHKIVDFIDYAKEKYNTHPEKTFVLGFSQGAILSYGLSLQFPNKVNHIIALSGYLAPELIPENISSEIKTEYYISHGTVDQVIPVSWANKAPEQLKKFGLKTTYSEYPVGHGVSPQNFYSLKSWIEERL